VYRLSVGLCALALVTLVGFELGARLILPEKLAGWREHIFGVPRYVFYTAGSFQNKAGYTKYAPNAVIREIAYYPDGSGRMTPEYDCTYRSDRLGFLSNHVDYEASDILLLGDSFAQGQGGCEWISRLDPAVRSRVYSTAVMGFGAPNWRSVVADLKNLKQPRKVLIVFITDNFVRADWQFTDGQLDCLNGRGDCAGYSAYPISENMSEVAAQRHTARYAPKAGVALYLKSYLIASYGLYKILSAESAVAQQVLLKPGLDIVLEWTRRYDVKFLWVNETGDMELTGARAQALARGLAGQDVTRCRIPRDQFLPRDGHPTAAGYDVLKGCVEDVVRRW
jgi:hypothetical protein